MRVLKKKNTVRSMAYNPRRYSDSKNSKQSLLRRGLIGQWVDGCLSRDRWFDDLYLFVKYSF
jgi:hypothetical protein